MGVEEPPSGSKLGGPETENVANVGIELVLNVDKVKHGLGAMRQDAEHIVKHKEDEGNEQRSSGRWSCLSARDLDSNLNAICRCARSTELLFVTHKAQRRRAAGPDTKLLWMGKA